MENNGLLEAISDMMDSKIEPIKNILEEHSKQFDIINIHFEEIDTHFKEIDTRFEEIDTRFEKMDAQFESLNTKVDNMDKKLDTTYNEVARIKEDVTGIKISVETLGQNVDFVESATLKNLIDIRQIKNSKSQA